MNPWLAEMYGTAGTGGQTDAGDEGTEKQAQLELFAKLAADEGIDLTKLTPEQVNDLYANVFQKQAQEEEGSEEDKKEDEAEESKKEEAEAKAEHEAKKEGAAKLAEAELMGQVMAHSFVHELGEIEKAAEEKKAPVTERAGRAVGRHAEKVTAGLGAAYGGVGGAVTGKALARRLGSKGRLAATVGGAALGAGAGGLAGRGYGRLAKGMTQSMAEKKEKKASAFDTVAAKNAIKLAAAAGYDEAEAGKLIESVYNLGLEESEKVAYIEDTSDALHVRSLEFLEKAGFKVNWDEVFPPNAE